MAQRLGNVPAGQIVKLKEKGSPVNYLVVNQGLPSAMYDASCNGTWLLRVALYSNQPWDRDNGNAYAASTIKNYLNTTILPLYDSAVSEKIKTVKIPYADGTSGGFAIHQGVNGLTCKIFLLSAREMGKVMKGGSIPSPNDGTKLAYFNLDSHDGANADPKRVAKLNNTASKYWSRSPYNNGQYRNVIWFIDETGAFSSMYTVSVSAIGVRPAMILPSDLLISDDGLISGETYPIPPATITVPTEPVPTGSTIAVSWSPVSSATYQLQRSIDGGSWEDLYSGGNTSYNDTAGLWDKVQYRVASIKSGATSGYTTSKEVLVLPYTVEKINAPSQAMEGQSVPVSWSAVAAANTYVLEHKSSAADWTQIYSGADTQFKDTLEDGWTTVQYRVKAGKDGTFGPWRESQVIPVISASALVISGQDGNLGVITSDVPYTVSTDTGNPITLERYVNGILVTRITVESGFAYSIPVMELPTGAGTIKLVCSVTPSAAGPVTATRIWGYTKAVVKFPDEGGPAVLQQDGKKVLPVTLAECIKVPVNWGGSLDKGLELLLPLLNTAVMATGSYTGTGTFGQDNPNELTFEFAPEIVIISGASGSITISNKEPSGGQADGYIQGETVTWYSTSAAKQLNTQGELYSYWAVGKAVQA